MRALPSLASVLVATAVIASAGPADAVTSLDKVRACQRRVYLHTRDIARYVASRVERCTLRIEYCKLRNEIDGDDLALCLERAQSYCDDIDLLVSTRQTTREASAAAACSLIDARELTQLTEGLGFGALMQECPATTVPDLMACLFSRARCRAERQVFRIDPRSADALATAGIAASFPCVGP